MNFHSERLARLDSDVVGVYAVAKMWDKAHSGGFISLFEE